MFPTRSLTDRRPMAGWKLTPIVSFLAELRAATLLGSFQSNG
jgi:hypothetical protein